MNQHTKIYIREKPYTCYHFDKPFSNNTDLSRHLMEHKEENHFKIIMIRFFPSNECGKTQKDNIKVMPHHYNYCNKQFLENNKLVVHIGHPKGFIQYRVQ